MKITKRQLRRLINEAIRDVKYFNDNIDSIDIDSVSKKDLISMYGNRTGKLAIGGKINNFQKLFGMTDLDVDVFFVPKQLLLQHLSIMQHL